MSNTRYDFGHHQTILAIKLDEHLHDTSNPHKIDKRQVGLGNVDNVSFDEIKNYTNTYAGSYLAVESDEEGKYNISLYNKNNQKLGESIEIDTDNEFTITSVSLDLENKKLIFKRENASDLTCDISSLINYVDSKFDKTGGTITGDVTIYANNDTNEPHGKLTVGGTNHKVTILGNPTDGANVIVGNTYYESSKIEDSLAATGISFADQSWNLVLYSALGDVKANDTIIPKNKTLETTDNKVSSWSPTTTDTHYPSEKLVKAECDNIRAVAEGKCKTYVLSYSTTAPTEETFSSGRYCTSDGTPLDTWEEFISYLSPITPTLLVNRNFNSQSGYISLEFTEEEEEGEVITYNCSYLLVKRVENNSWKYMVLKFLDILQPEVTPFKIGDMFLVTETNVPDRWYAGWNVLYKLETSKVDLGWSQIGTTEDPKPTTLFGYGITDAISNATNIENGSGTSAIQGKIQDGKSTFNTNIDGLEHTSGASGEYATLFGGVGEASGKRSTALGGYNVAVGHNTLATGEATKAIGRSATSFGQNTIAEGNASIAEGYKTKATGAYSHAEGGETEAIGQYSFAGGSKSKTKGGSSFAFGYNARTINKTDYDTEKAATPGSGSGSGGSYTPPPSTIPQNSLYSISLGISNDAIGNAALATGVSTDAYGDSSASFGYQTSANGQSSIAEGSGSIATGNYSHAAGFYTVTPQRSQFAVGEYNIGESTSIFEVGNGSAANSRHNAFTVYSDGHATLALQGTTSDSVTRYSFVIGQVTTLDNKKADKYNPTFNGVLTLGNSLKVNADARTLTFGNQEAGYGATGADGIAIGYNTKATATDSIALGNNTIAGHQNQVVLGFLNENKDTTLFEVGNGTWAAGRKNVFEVNKDGTAKVGAMGTADLSVATKAYVDDISATKVDKNATSVSITGWEKVNIMSMGNITLYASAGDVIIKSDTASDTSKVAIDGTVIPKNKTLLTTDGGAVSGNLTAPNLTATNSIKIGNTTLDEDDLKRLLGSLVVNGTSNGDLY